MSKKFHELGANDEVALSSDVPNKATSLSDTETAKVPTVAAVNTGLEAKADAAEYVWSAEDYQANIGIAVCDVDPSTKPDKSHFKLTESGVDKEIYSVSTTSSEVSIMYDVIVGISGKVLYFRLSDFTKSVSSYEKEAACAAALTAAAQSNLAKTMTDGKVDDLSILFSHVDSSKKITIDNLLNNSALEKSIKICAEAYGGTQIKKDEDGNYYYEVETEE